MISAESFTPTPDAMVGETLSLGHLRAGGLHVDLGSGDGRLVIAAARLGARSIGYETDGELVTKSRLLLWELRINAQIIQADCLGADLGQADVVTAYFPSELGEAVIAKFHAEAKPGAVLVLRGDGFRCFKK